MLFGLFDVVEHCQVRILDVKMMEEKQQHQNASDSASFYLMRLGIDSLAYYLVLLQKVLGFAEASSCNRVLVGDSAGKNPLFSNE